MRYQTSCCTKYGSRVFAINPLPFHSTLNTLYTRRSCTIILMIVIILERMNSHVLCRFLPFRHAKNIDIRRQLPYMVIGKMHAAVHQQYLALQRTSQKESGESHQLTNRTWKTLEIIITHNWTKNSSPKNSVRNVPKCHLVKGKCAKGKDKR